MNINITKNEAELTVALDGRLDTLTSPELEEQLEEALDGVEKLVFELDKLTYISSSGLRVFLGAFKAMEEQGGEMLLRNLTDNVKEVFEITGFADAFGIE